MAIMFGIFAMVLGALAALAAGNGKQDRPVAITSGLLCAAFVAGAVVLELVKK